MSGLLLLDVIRFVIWRLLSTPIVYRTMLPGRKPASPPESPNIVETGVTQARSDRCDRPPSPFQPGRRERRTSRGTAAAAGSPAERRSRSGAAVSNPIGDLNTSGCRLSARRRPACPRRGVPWLLVRLQDLDRVRRCRRAGRTRWRRRTGRPAPAARVADSVTVVETSCPTALVSLTVDRSWPPRPGSPEAHLNRQQLARAAASPRLSSLRGPRDRTGFSHSSSMKIRPSLADRSVFRGRADVVRVCDHGQDPHRPSR